MTCACNPNADDDFGPLVSSCCRELDFTLLFEDAVLGILPNLIFVILALLRLVALTKRPAQATRGRLYIAKCLMAIILLALQSAVLSQLATVPGIPRSNVSIAAAVIYLCALLLMCFLLDLEHTRAYRPSSILATYLLLIMLFEVPKTRTYFLLGSEPVAYTMTFQLVALTSLLFLENQSKRSSLSDADRDKSAEELVGPLNRTFFYWLHPLMGKGYRGTLGPNEVKGVDKRLYSVHLEAKFRAIDQGLNEIASVNRLIFATLRALGTDLFLPLLPRIAVTGFTFAQPFLINSMLNQLNKADDQHAAYGNGLICATLLIYLGIAISNGWYWQSAFRAATMLRGGLLIVLFEKLLRMPEDAEVESQAMTLMFNDLSRILRFCSNIHELWAAVLEAALATWLLYDQLGAASFMMLAIAVGIGASCLFVARRISGKQQVWLKAVQERLGATKRMLSSFKAIKMLSLDERIYNSLTRLRNAEFAAAWPFRQLQVTSALLSYGTLTLAPPLTFAVYLGAGIAGAHLDTAKIFTSLTLIGLLANPLVHLFQTIPTCGAAYGCYTRIHKFLQTKERRDPRILSTTWSSSESNQTKENFHTSETKEGHLLMVIEKASFGWTKESTILRDVDLEVRAGSHIAILGKVGSGKTLLLKALLGEAEQPSGQVVLKPRISYAYCSQTAWLVNESAEENLMGSAGGQYVGIRPSRDTIVRACELSDIAGLSPHSTDTVGSGGIRLSGGQRQRLALARTFLLGKQIILLDDVFSGLDEGTKSRVARNLLGRDGGVEDPSRAIVYTTHDENIASLADEIYEIDAAGSLSRRHDLENIHTPKESDSLRDIDDHASKGHETKQAAATELQPRLQDQADKRQDGAIAVIGDKAVFKSYFQAMGRFRAAVFFALGIVFAVALKFPDIWVQWWSNALKAGDERPMGYWLGIYAGLQVLPLVALPVWLWHLLSRVVPAAGVTLHDRLLRTTIGASFPYISRLDSGTIINRFNQDLMFVDSQLPFDLFNASAELYIAIVQIFLIAVASSQLLAVVPAVFGILYMVQRYYLRTSKQLRLLELEAKAGLHTTISEVAAGPGLSTIRAHDWQGRIRERFLAKLNRAQEPEYLLYSVQRWLQLVLNLLVAALVAIIAGVAVALGKVNTGAVGVAFLNATTLGETLTQLVLAWTSLETALGAIARIVSFEKMTPGESQRQEDQPLVDDRHNGEHLALMLRQSAQGSLRLENVWASYSDAADVPSIGEAENSRWALRGITCQINPGERVSVCGRTGSGKSTLLLALLRMVNIPAGSILVNGIDHAGIPLSDLRRGFHVISQDKLEDSGSIRDLIDPHTKYTDDQVRAVLEDCGIQDIVARVGGIDANAFDCNMSVGEAQLFSIARTILYGRSSGSGIVLLDEATSSVDRETELKVEELLTTHLKGKTTIAIRHRLDAALRSDKIIIMAQGRIIDIGTPGEILQRCDLFTNLRREMESITTP